MTAGYIRDEDEHLARDVGVCGLVLKLFTVDELGRVLDELHHGSELKSRSRRSSSSDAAANVWR